MAIVITVSQGKGGSAKTTTSVNLAGALNERSRKTILFDWDLEKPDAVRWMKEGNQIDWIHLIDKHDPVKVIEYAKKECDFIIFDTPPNYDQNAFKAIMACDFVIIPTSVNHLDQENTKEAITVPLLAKKPFKILMSRVKKGTKEGKDIFNRVLNQEISFNTVITDRNIIAQCPSKGEWIGQFSIGSESHNQFLSLADEVIIWTDLCHARGIELEVTQ